MFDRCLFGEIVAKSVPSKPAKTAAKKTAGTTKKQVAGAKKIAAKKQPAKKQPAKKQPTKKQPAPAKKASVPAKKDAAKKTVVASKPAKAAPQPKSSPPKKTQVPLPAATLEKLRSILLAERSTYLRQAEDLAAEAAALIAEREPGEVQFDEESGEGDTIAAERERDLTLSASARAAVEEIDRALERIDTTGYGYCANCGTKIPMARLEALPYAALCIPCKSREERRR